MNKPQTIVEAAENVAIAWRKLKVAIYRELPKPIRRFINKWPK